MYSAAMRNRNLRCPLSPLRMTSLFIETTLAACLMTPQWTTDWYSNLMVVEWWRITTSPSNSQLHLGCKLLSSNSIPFLKLFFPSSSSFFWERSFKPKQQEAGAKTWSTRRRFRSIEVTITGLKAAARSGPRSKVYPIATFPDFKLPETTIQVSALKTCSTKNSTGISFSFFCFFVSILLRKVFIWNKSLLKWNIGHRFSFSQSLAILAKSSFYSTRKGIFWASGLFKSFPKRFVSFLRSSGFAISTFVITTVKGILNAKQMRICSFVIFSSF